MTAIKTIRQAIEARIEAQVEGFTKLQNKFNLAKNNSSNVNKRYGVRAKEGAESDGVLTHLTIDRTFEITICNRFVSTNNGDLEQEIVGDMLEDFMEKIAMDITSTKIGLPALVISANFSDTEPINYDDVENLAFLRFNMIVKYRKPLTS